MPHDEPAIGVPVAGVVEPASGDATSCSLRADAERAALSSASEHTLLARLSLKAPSASADLKRAPLDLVCCIDRSGSMRGEKMKLMKQTLDLLVRRAGLRADDRLSLVSFDSSVKLDQPLTAMDGAGRAQAEGVVRALHPGSTTNLSGGALKAVDQLASDGGGAGRTRAVLLFTDGLATDGIRDTPSLVAAVTGALAQASKAGPISLYTFGFGADHNEEMMRELATASAATGLYYYIKDPDEIPNAFADCLGGLVSVVAQNACLSISALEGAKIEKVFGAYTRGADGAIDLGDLFSDDEKDILLELRLPALPAPGGAAPVLRAALRAFNVARVATDEAVATLEVARPKATPADQPINTALDEQANRLRVAQAMEEASKMADRGDLDGGRALLVGCRAHVSSSASRETPLSCGLAREIESLEHQYRSEHDYRSVGSKMSKMSATSHHRQRANHTNAAMYEGAKARKAAMKSSWAAAMSRPGADSDSD